MKSRDTFLRLKRFQAQEKRRRAAQIEMMIAEFERMAGDLDREIAQEEERSGHSDPSHFAYPTYAKAARSRRDNLVSSASELKGQLSEAKAELTEALEELGKAESLDDRERAGDEWRAPEARAAGARMSRAGA